MHGLVVHKASAAVGQLHSWRKDFETLQDE